VLRCALICRVSRAALRCALICRVSRAALRADLPLSALASLHADLPLCARVIASPYVDTRAVVDTEARAIL